MPKPIQTLEAVAWDAARRGLRLLDQTRLPAETCYVTCTSLEAVHDAIRRLVVRGAPAIGIAAAYGTVVGVQDSQMFRSSKTSWSYSRPG